MSRKSKGYNWEVKVKSIFEEKGFVVERLGGTTTEMPDVVAHKDDSKLIIAIECKSVSGTLARVPFEQLQRCIDETQKWGLYDTKMVILAFQFAKFGKVGDVHYREKREYLKIWNWWESIGNISCNYNGVIRRTYEKIELEEFKI